MFIAINGQLGSGKSAVCDILQQEFGFSVFSTGKIQRKLAENLGISTLELNIKGKDDFSYDYMIDKALIDYANEHIGDNVVFDSRMAWHFVPGAYKVHLLVNPSIAADRVFLNRKATSVEAYASKEDALTDLIKRREAEDVRYKMVYNVSMRDFNNYDLILDTSSLLPKEVCEIILSEYEKQNRAKQTVIVSPTNVYPTENIRAVYTDRVEYYKKEIKSGKGLAPIQLIKVDDCFYVFDGHHRVIASNLCKVKRINAIIMCQDEELLSMKISAREYVAVNLSDIYDWEDLNGFSFNYYPKLLQR